MVLRAGARGAPLRVHLHGTPHGGQETVPGDQGEGPPAAGPGGAAHVLHPALEPKRDAGADVRGRAPIPAAPGCKGCWRARPTSIHASCSPGSGPTTCSRCCQQPRRQFRWDWWKLSRQVRFQRQCNRGWDRWSGDCQPRLGSWRWVAAIAAAAATATFGGAPVRLRARAPQHRARRGWILLGAGWHWLPSAPTWSQGTRPWRASG
mmetsp:Transcript_2290/g.6563  ORF Transcript_2290/g.6563 Transcript_2290/m.6563 type:complete len:206 (-) Transcript_2290:359-976(-)